MEEEEEVEEEVIVPLRWGRFGAMQAAVQSPALMLVRGIHNLHIEGDFYSCALD